MHPLEQQANAHPDRLAVRNGGISLSFSQLYEQAAAAADVMRSEYGIGSGSRVATLAATSLAHFLVLHGAMLLGATIVPLNTRLSSIEREAQLRMLEPDLLIVETPVETHAPRRTAILADLLAAGVREMIRPVEPDSDALVSVLFTSGTSGIPKAVPHTWAQHRASAEGSRVKLGCLSEDAWLCVIPLYHIGGLAILVRSMLYGTAVVFPAESSAAGLAQELRDGVTIASLVPTMLHRIFEADRGLRAETCPKLRAILLGGGAASGRLWEEIRTRQLPVLGTYGMTETCSQVCTVAIDQLELLSGTAGTPIAGAEIEIRSTDGAVCPAGIAGEIWVRGAMVTSGYLNNSRLNAGRFEAGWFRTGDIGLMDGNGALSVLARREDMIVSGGENMYPSEIEDVLLLYPGVRECVVIGLPDEEYGQRLAAVVSGPALQVEELERWCREQLGGFKTPKLWRLVEELPRTASGKISRADARALFT